MGLLDDAIREHLELKRRRGADPDEVARQEDEALGDPRRGEFAQPDAAPAAEPRRRAAGARAGAAPPSRPAGASRAGASEPVGPARRRAGARAAPPEPPAPRDEPWLEDERADRCCTSRPPSSRRPDVEPEPEVVRPDDEPPADEDVLEETPDFLQETPEHDRLWFEQKPPRDFDFDNLALDA